MSAIQNRIQKNHDKLKDWAQKHQIEAFRIFDRDIPEYPFIVDLYKNYLVVFDRRDPRIDSAERKQTHLPELVEALKAIFNFPESHIILKKRERQRGDSQYEKIAARGEFLTIREGQALFKVNLHDYLDTGLFLDHRLMRQKIFNMSSAKKVLNLFCYTGSISVFAALGGGTVTSVDMSSTYIKWAQDNFTLNRIPLSAHHFVTMDALKFLENSSKDHGQKYDLIFLDPPTFSNSKRMDGTFEVERDQQFLVESCMAMLSPGGTFFFSNNKRDFKLNESLMARYSPRDITKSTLPKDFRDPKVHHVFEFRSNPKAL